MRGQEVVEPCGTATTLGVNSHPARQEPEVEETVDKMNLSGFYY